MLLYMAARPNWSKRSFARRWPKGKIVLCDRYLLANVAYQGHGGGMDVAALWQVGRVATGGLMPELTLLLDMPADAAAARIQRPFDRMERQGAEFHARVREGFLYRGGPNPSQIIVIDAARPVEQVQAELAPPSNKSWPVAASGGNRESP